MRNKEIVDNTTNRGVFNRAYKVYLEQSGKIRCSRCGYHRGENDKRKWYGSFDEKSIRKPSWKLVSKNRNQWMKKSIRFIKCVDRYRNKTYVEIKFST
jgi:hypothetical protein